MIILFIKIYMGCKLKLADKDLYPNIHTILKCSIVLPVTSVCCERTISALCKHKTWVRSTMTGERLCGLAMLSQKHGCESGKHFKTMMPLATVKLEDFLWTAKTCSNLNSSYNYIKKYLFRTFIFNIYPSPVHENAYEYIKINKLIHYKVSSSYQSFFHWIEYIVNWTIYSQGKTKPVYIYQSMRETVLYL